MKHFSPKKWCFCFLTVTCILLVVIAGATFFTDPLFHYRSPRAGLNYVLNDERMQNNGILRHFDYDSVILGTSMTQQFMVSEADELFGADFVKVSMSGATFKELADELDCAFKTHEVRYVVRDAFDVSASMADDKDAIPTHYTAPTYLYNDDPFDDVSYLLNFDVFTRFTLPIFIRWISGKPAGITSFDQYETWEARPDIYGADAFPNLWFQNNVEQTKHFTQESYDVMKANLDQNVLRFANEHPETIFYLFIPPYSIVKWGEDYTRGIALERIEMEEAGIKELLAYDNIRIFSFGRDLDIVANLDNYCNMTHYGKWINSFILEAMAGDDERYRITTDNYEEYIEDLKQIYLNYDYESLNSYD